MPREEWIPTKGTKVHARKPSRKVGRTTGGSRPCGLESCGGLQIATRWADGKLTWLCTKGLDTKADGSLVIV